MSTLSRSASLRFFPFRPIAHLRFCSVADRSCAGHECERAAEGSIGTHVTWEGTAFGQ
jgi:hypothetical protein